MIKQLLFIAIIVIAGQIKGYSQTSDLTVIVQGIKSHKGKIRIGLFDNADDFKAKINPVVSAVVIIHNNGVATYTFHKLPQGTYAVAVYHDENNDDILNKKQLGIPVEGIGFSNFPEFKRRPPAFEEVAFELKDKYMTLHIPLFYNKKKQQQVTSNQ